MHVTLVHVYVKTDHIDDFIKATAANQSASIKETGNLRFDVLQQADDPQRFVFYEVYEDAIAAAAHKTTDHYRIWRESVAQWMASPRQGILHNSLYPQLLDQWKTIQ